MTSDFNYLNNLQQSLKTLVPGGLENVQTANLNGIVLRKEGGGNDRFEKMTFFERMKRIFFGVSTTEERTNFQRIEELKQKITQLPQDKQKDFQGLRLALNRMERKPFDVSAFDVPYAVSFYASKTSQPDMVQGTFRAISAALTSPKQFDKRSVEEWQGVINYCADKIAQLKQVPALSDEQKEALHAYEYLQHTFRCMIIKFTTVNNAAELGVDPKMVLDAFTTFDRCDATNIDHALRQVTHVRDAISKRIETGQLTDATIEASLPYVETALYNMKQILASTKELYASEHKKTLNPQIMWKGLQDAVQSKLALEKEHVVTKTKAAIMAHASHLPSGPQIIAEAFRVFEAGTVSIRDKTLETLRALREKIQEPKDEALWVHYQYIRYALHDIIDIIGRGPTPPTSYLDKYKCLAGGRLRLLSWRLFDFYDRRYQLRSNCYLKYILHVRDCPKESRPLISNAKYLTGHPFRIVLGGGDAPHNWYAFSPWFDTPTRTIGHNAAFLHTFECAKQMGSSFLSEYDDGGNLTIIMPSWTDLADMDKLFSAYKEFAKKTGNGNVSQLQDVRMCRIVDQDYDRSWEIGEWILFALLQDIRTDLQNGVTDFASIGNLQMEIAKVDRLMQRLRTEDPPVSDERLHPLREMSAYAHILIDSALRKKNTLPIVDEVRSTLYDVRKKYSDTGKRESALAEFLAQKRSPEYNEILFRFLPESQVRDIKELYMQLCDLRAEFSHLPRNLSREALEKVYKERSVGFSNETAFTLLTDTLTRGQPPKIHEALCKIRDEILHNGFSDWKTIDLFEYMVKNNFSNGEITTLQQDLETLTDLIPADPLQQLSKPLQKLMTAKAEIDKMPSTDSRRRVYDMLLRLARNLFHENDLTMQMSIFEEIMNSNLTDEEAQSLQRCTALFNEEFQHIVARAYALKTAVPGPLSKNIYPVLQTLISDYENTKGFYYSPEVEAVRLFKCSVERSFTDGDMRQLQECLKTLSSEPKFAAALKISEALEKLYKTKAALDGVIRSAEPIETRKKQFLKLCSDLGDVASYALIERTTFPEGATALQTAYYRGYLHRNLKKLSQDPDRLEHVEGKADLTEA